VHGPVDLTDDRGQRAAAPTRPHRQRQAMPPQVALGLSVTAVLAVLGITASPLPASFTGSGTPAELPAAAVAALAPGASGGVPDDRTATRPAPSTTSPSLSVTPAQTGRTATKAAPKNTATTFASRPSGLEGQEKRAEAEGYDDHGSENVARGQ